MSRAPNPEQKLSIEHFGGVLLEAGAGSGKTFVLVEHVFFLLEKKYEFLLETVPEEMIVDELRHYLSTVVMMTFTNKAAGEMSLRLREKSKELQKDSSAPKYKVFEDALDSLNILTIDGFCSKLVKEGFFSDVPSQFEIVDSFSYKQKIETLIFQWYEQYEGSKEDVFDSMLHQIGTIVTTFVSIFSTPELRVLWKTKSANEMLKVEWNSYLSAIIKLLNIPTTIPLCPFDEKYFAKGHDTSEYYKKLNGLLMQNLNIESYTDFEKAFVFYKNQGKPDNRRTPRGDEAKQWKDIAAAHREFVIEVGDMIFAYNEQEDLLKKWVNLLHSVFSYIDNHYLDDNYFCFGDLEYYVFLGLNDAEVVELIGQNYQYFIVDEFQDTSQIQFDILDKLARKDLSKLFAVGDKKQAIYAFRGGEVSVFNQCAKRMQEQGLQNLYLTHNYRSLGNVIEFNNEIFANIFKLGSEFSGIDNFAVDVVKQTIPLEEKQGIGQIYKIQRKITAKEKFSLSNDDLNYLESEALVEHARMILSKEPKGDICFLYKTLTPLKILFPMLLHSGLDFVSQIKIDQKEDPVVLIFCFLVKYLAEREREQSQEAKENQDSEDSVTGVYSKLIQGVLYYLDNEKSEQNIRQELEGLLEHHQLFGLQTTVNKFFYNLGISNSNYAANMSQIESLVAESFNDFHDAYTMLGTGFDDRYSIEFQKGSGGRIIVMTAHASKGLEFDHVFMGGLSTNGHRMPERGMIGKEPGSFKWKVDFSKKDLINTPQFYLEKEIAKAKDFAESKRLFYVVGTRAVKSISWVDLSYDDGKKQKDLGTSNSWVFGTRAFENSIVTKSDNDSFLNVMKVIQECSQQKLIEFPFEKLVENSGAPLFHLDHIGVEQCDRDQNQEQLLVLSELSVTSLASLSSCPKRFYLKNILKIRPERFELLEVEDSLTDQYKQEVEEGRRLEEVRSFGANSAQRGTLIHESIYEGIKNNFSCPEEIEKTADINAIEWALNLVEQKSKTHQLIAEVEVKFDFFGMKISGIPDIVLISDECEEVQIWDYKTGRRKESKESVYMTQLRYYCYGLLRLDDKRRNYKIFASLLYVDMQEVVDFSFEYDDLEQFLFAEFGKMNQLTQENRESCQFCAFKQLCPPLQNL